MNFTPSVSVIILNRGRPHLLPRVLTALRSQRYANFEVIVVGDRADVDEYGLPEPLARSFGYLHCPQANICRARNIGIAAARGEIVAFCDDDGVPEPDWLQELVIAFAAPSVAAAGGYVRGPDGVNFQWAGGGISSIGEEYGLPACGEAIRIFEADCGVRASVLGVNSAFRRSDLLEVGGFDESYRYYLDESDAVMRLVATGRSVAHVPRAQVHHHYAENDHRTRSRKPRDFYEIAASLAHFLRQHGPQTRVDESIAAFRARKMADVDRFIRLGVMTSRERRHLERRFDAGAAEGLARSPVTPLRDRGAPAGPLRPFTAWHGEAAPRVALVGGWSSASLLRGFARDLAEGGTETSLIRFSFGAAPLRVAFEDGVWIHGGGTWRLNWPGRRRGPIHRGGRSRMELRRVMQSRQFEVIVRPASRRFAYGPLDAIIVKSPTGIEDFAVEPVGPDNVALAARIAAELRQRLESGSVREAGAAPKAGLAARADRPAGG